jgi:hypothetical protein
MYLSFKYFLKRNVHPHPLPIIYLNNLFTCWFERITYKLNTYKFLSRYMIYNYIFFILYYFEKKSFNFHISLISFLLLFIFGVICNKLFYYLRWHCYSKLKQRHRTLRWDARLHCVSTDSVDLYSCLKAEPREQTGLTLCTLARGL